MSNLKRVLTVLLVVAFMAMSIVPAFAATATPADVKGTVYENAVAKLGSLGILTGFPDGTFQPDGTVTRAQMAAVVIRALGYDSTAKAAAGATKFSDVGAGHWASGYVNLASSLGIINGYPDGTFKGDDKVLYEQAVTMILRAMGYETLAVKKGGYPSGYMLVAGDKKVIKDVKGVSGTPAPRGMVAQLVNNALTIKMYGVTSVNDNGVATYGEVADTFLSKLGMTEVDDQWVTGTASTDTSLDSNQFTAGGTKYTVADGYTVDFESVLGQKVNLWKNSDGNVIAVESKTAASDIVSVKEIEELTYDASGNVTKMKVKKSDDKEVTYDVYGKTIGATLNQDVYSAANTLAVINTPVYGATTVKSDTFETKKEAYQVTLTVDGTDVKFINALVFSDPEKVSADPTINTVSSVIWLAGRQLQSDADTKVAKYVVIKNGKAADVKDIKKDDIIMVARNNAASGDIKNTKYYFIATDATVSGNLDSASPTLTAATKVKVDGTSYDVSAFAGSGTGKISVPTDAGNKVKLWLDKDGKVWAIDKDSVSNDKYAVVSKVAKSIDFGDATYKVKLVLPDGSSTTYNVDKDAGTDIINLIDGNYTKADPTVNTLIKYHLNSSSVIDSATVSANDAGFHGSANIDGDRDKVTIDATTYYAAKDVIAFNVKASDSSVQVMKWDSITGSTNAATVTSIFKNDDGDIAAILIYNSAISGSAKYALVSSVSTIKDAYAVDAYINGTLTTLITSDRTVVNDAYIKGGAVVTYALDANGKANSIAVVTGVYAVPEADLQAVDVDRNRIKVNNTYYYLSSDGCQIYSDKDGDGATVQALTLGNLYTNMKVKVFTDVKGDARVIVVTKW